MSNLYLPFPITFKPFLKNGNEEELPFWLLKCIKDENKKRYLNLFDDDLSFLNIDSNTVKAINEFAFNSVNHDSLFKDFLINSNKDLFFDDFDLKISLKNVLKRNSIKKLSDLNFKDSKLRTLSTKFPGLGKRKIFEIFLFISKKIENSKPNEILIHDSKNMMVNEDEGNALLNKISDYPTENYLFNDPRFINVENILFQYIEEHLDSETNLKEALQISVYFLPINKFKEAIEETIKILSEIKSLNFEGQIIHLCNAINKNNVIAPKYFDGIMDRIGIIASKEKIPTLQKVASRFDITRERIRQLESLFLIEKEKYFKDEHIFIDKFEEIKSILKDKVFLSSNEVENEIYKRNLGDWNLQRILAILDFLNNPSIYEIFKGTLNQKGNEDDVNTIRQIAKKIISYNGVVEINHLKEIIESLGIKLTDKNIKKVLSYFDEIAPNWLYVKTTNNLLENLADRISNFSKKISIQDIKDAHVKNNSYRSAQFTRDRSRTGFYGFLTPNNEAIKAYFIKNENFNVEDNSIIPLTDNGKKYIEDKKGSDYLLLELFKNRDFNALTDTELRESFVKLGGHEGSLRLYMSYKPYLKKFGRQIWGIVGHPPTDQDLKNTRNRIQKISPPKLEWSNTGVIEIKAQIGNVNSYAFMIKDNFLEYIEKDEFEIKIRDETYCKIKRSDKFWYGISKYLTNIIHCNSGDFISIKLDLINYEAFVTKISSSDYFD